ncbi:phosphomannose isomerase type II C-terminal cupin domain, partial [Eggerthella lenta]
VAATPDGILVSGKEESARLKPLVERAAESRPMCERRRWGEYRVLDAGAYEDGRRSLTKELVIEAGRQLSYQRHARRSEVWTVVSGEGEIVLDGEVRAVGPGSVVEVAPGRMHAARALSELRIVEVQLGDALVEEDIERFGSWW